MNRLEEITRLKKELHDTCCLIREMEKQIQTGEKSIRNTKVQTTPEIERLKVIRDEKKAIS